MSLAIDTNRVEAVLLVDGWHEVRGNTFDIDAYEYTESPNPDPFDKTKHDARTVWCSQGGSSENCSGFMFRDKATGKWIYGPMSSLLAVRQGKRKMVI